MGERCCQVRDCFVCSLSEDVVCLTLHGYEDHVIPGQNIPMKRPNLEPIRIPVVLDEYRLLELSERRMFILNALYEGHGKILGERVVCPYVGEEDPSLYGVRFCKLRGGRCQCFLDGARLSTEHSSIAMRGRRLCVMVNGECI